VAKSPKAYAPYETLNVSVPAKQSTVLVAARDILIVKSNKINALKRRADIDHTVAQRVVFTALQTINNNGVVTQASGHRI